VHETIGDRVLLCLPADHLIHGAEALQRAFLSGIEFAAKNRALVTFGITPSYPETGYGYIEGGETAAGSVYSVKRFVEKPDKQTATTYLASGGFYWNSGMFAWRASTLLEAIKHSLPGLSNALKSIATAPLTAVPELFASIDPISVDHGVMERAENVFMVGGVGFQWSDVGSWSSWLESVGAEQQNFTSGDALLLSSERTALISHDRFIAGIGLEDLIVVETADAVLVCHRSRSQEVKNIVDALRERGKKELL
jgi:mannose-1-phosphate guanylyltransferase/mannose-6-phosphate isomerase